MNENEAITSARRALGRRLSQLRTRAGLTQQQLAAIALYSRGSIAAAETGRQHIPDRTFWERSDHAVGADGDLLKAFDRLAALIVERREKRFEAAHRRRYGATVTITAPQSETEDVNRRELLRVLSMAGAAIAVSPRDDPPVGRPVLEDSEDLNATLWRSFALARTKQAAMPMVRDQIGLLVEQLAAPQTPAARDQLCAQAADVFQLAGEINFDANRYTDAAHCYSLAASAAREIDSWDLWACALVRHAFIHLYERQFGQAEPLLAVARQVASRGDRQLSTRYWAAAVHAQALAGIGDVEGTRRAFDLAEKVATLPQPAQRSGWLRFDSSRLAEERGAAYVMLYRPDLARPVLIDALEQHVSARRRGAILADLAVIGAQRGDLEEVVTYAGQALDVADSTRSGYVTRKLQALPPQLGRMRNDPRIDTLTRQLAV